MVTSDAAAGDWFGRSVAADGGTVLSGAPLDDHVTGTHGSASVFWAPFFEDDFADSGLPPDWVFERGTWQEREGNLHGEPDGEVGSKIKVRAIADPAFSGCTVCTVEAEIKTTNIPADTDPAKVSAHLLTHYASKQTNFAVKLKPEQDKILISQKQEKAARAEMTGVPGSVGGAPAGRGLGTDASW